MLCFLAVIMSIPLERETEEDGGDLYLALAAQSLLLHQSVSLKPPLVVPNPFFCFFTFITDS